MSLLGTAELDRPIKQSEGNRLASAWFGNAEKLIGLGNQAQRTRQESSYAFGDQPSDNNARPSAPPAKPTAGNIRTVERMSAAANFKPFSSQGTSALNTSTPTQSGNTQDAQTARDLRFMQDKKETSYLTAVPGENQASLDNETKYQLAHQQQANADPEPEDQGSGPSHLLELVEMGGAAAAAKKFSFNFSLWHHHPHLLRRAIFAVRRALKTRGKRRAVEGEKTNEEALLEKNKDAQARKDATERAKTESQEAHDAAVLRNAPQAEQQAAREAAQGAEEAHVLQVADAGKTAAELAASTERVASLGANLSRYRKMNLFKAPFRLASFFVPGAIAAAIVYKLAPEGESPEEKARHSEKAFNNDTWGTKATKAAEQHGFFAGAKQFGLETVRSINGLIEFGLLAKDDPSAAYNKVKHDAKEVVHETAVGIRLLDRDPQTFRKVVEGTETIAEAVAADPTLAGEVRNAITQGGGTTTVSSTTLINAATNTDLMSGISHVAPTVQAYRSLNGASASSDKLPEPDGRKVRDRVTPTAKLEEPHPPAS